MSQPFHFSLLLLLRRQRRQRKRLPMDFKAALERPYRH